MFTAAILHKLGYSVGGRSMRHTVYTRVTRAANVPHEGFPLEPKLCTSCFCRGFTAPLEPKSSFDVFETYFLKRNVSYLLPRIIRIYFGPIHVSPIYAEQSGWARSEP